ncbi:MAG: hypothetical protein IJB00_00100 [Akkermansia sp.]|nr:hypothetical protein [Akkermansia sp.]
MGRIQNVYKPMLIAVDVNQNAMVADMLRWLPVFLGVVCVVLRAVSEQVRRGAAADILTAASVVTGCIYCTICSFFFPQNSLWMLFSGGCLLLFAVVGWRVPLRVCRKAFSGRKSRRGKRVHYYLMASLLRAPWALWVLLCAVQNLSLCCMEKESAVQFFMLMRWGHMFAVIPVLLCLLRLYRKHRIEAARRCLIISVAVFFLS